MYKQHNSRCNLYDQLLFLYLPSNTIFNNTVLFQQNQEIITIIYCPYKYNNNNHIILRIYIYGAVVFLTNSQTNINDFSNIELK